MSPNFVTQYSGGQYLQELPQTYVTRHWLLTATGDGTRVVNHDCHSKPVYGQWIIPSIWYVLKPTQHI